MRFVFGRAFLSELKASALSKLVCCKAIGLENSLFFARIVIDVDSSSPEPRPVLTEKLSDRKLY